MFLRLLDQKSKNCVKSLRPPIEVLLRLMGTTGKAFQSMGAHLGKRLSLQLVLNPVAASKLSSKLLDLNSSTFNDLNGFSLS